MVAKRNRTRKQKIKEVLFDFKKRKETKRRGMNASQLAIRNFNDVIEKHTNTPCVVLRGFP